MGADRLLKWARLVTVRGTWASLGLHVHFWPPGDSHFDVHFIWWVLTLGPGAVGMRQAEEDFRQMAAEGQVVCYQPRHDCDDNLADLGLPGVGGAL